MKTKTRLIKLAVGVNKTGFNCIINHFNIRERPSIIRCDEGLSMIFNDYMPYNNDGNN